MKFTNSKVITALKNGMIYTIPFIIVGAVFLLLTSLPWKPAADWMTSTGLVPYFNQAYTYSFAIMSILAVVGIAYEWAKNEKVDPLPSGLIALAGFFIIMHPTSPIKNAAGKVLVNNVKGITGIIDVSWLGGQGMVAAIIVGLITGWLYSWFIKKNITIKMPEQVPTNVASSFTALIPAAAIISGWMLVYMGFDHFTGQSLVEFIYHTIQTPLQGTTDSFGGVIIVSIMISFLWIFGVHGSTIVGGIMTAILLSNNADNVALFHAGKAISSANGGHIFTQALLDQFGTVTGAGMTIGLVVYMLFFARSEQVKSLGALEVVPALFNINEPVLFGLPIVLNPMIILPFILTPLLSMSLTYGAIKIGIIPYFNGIYVPWTTPPIISGFLVGGWRTALWQALMLTMSFFVYLPFIRRYDSMLYKQEQDNLAAKEA